MFFFPMLYLYIYIEILYGVYIIQAFFINANILFMVDIQSMTSFQISELNTTMINVSSTVFGISVNVYMNETSPSCTFSPVSRPDSQYI